MIMAQRAFKIGVLVAGISAALVVATAQIDVGSQRKSFMTRLNGYQEVPAVFTKGAGEFRMTVDANETKISWELDYDNLTSTPTAAHIHFGLPGTNGGVTAFLCGGSKPACPPNGMQATGEIIAADVLAMQGIPAGGLAELLQAIRAGATYVNAHTAAFPGGEIRGPIGRPRNPLARGGAGTGESEEGDSKGKGNAFGKSKGNAGN